MFLTNGKLGLELTSDASPWGGLDVSKAVISHPEKAWGAPLDCFKFSRFRFFSSTLGDTVQTTVQPMAVDTNTGAVTATYEVRISQDYPDESLQNSLVCTVTHTVRALKTLPHFVLHRLVVSPDPDILELTSDTAGTLQVFHEISSSNSPELRNSRFAGFTLYSDEQNKTCYMTMAAAESSSSDVEIDVASCYLLGNGVAHTGMNVLRADKSTCLTRLSLSAAQSQSPTTIDVLTGALASSTSGYNRTSTDNADLLKRAVLAATVGDDPIGSILTKDDAAWAQLWRANIVVQPRSGVSEEGLYKIERFNSAVRDALYTLHSTARPGSAVDVTETCASGQADLFIIPALLFTQTDAALSYLDERYANLDLARKHASALGLRGAKYPHDETEAVPSSAALGYLAFNAQAPLRLIGTCLTSMAIWNYYRMSRDKDWLSERGYVILRDCADMICSAAQLKVVANSTSYTIPSVVGLDDETEPVYDNITTIVTAQLALRAAIEASYELGYYPKELWKTVRLGLRVPLLGNSTSLLSLSSGQSSAPADGTVGFLEPLLVLAPWFNEILVGLENVGSVAGFADAIQSNFPVWARLDLLRKRVRSGPVSDLLYLQATAQWAQAFTPVVSNANAIEQALFDFLDVHGDGLKTDMTLAAQFILIIVTVLGGAMVRGGVTETRFNYSEFGTPNSSSNATLPASWDRVILQGLGPDNTLSFTLRNALLYAQPYVPRQVAPWTVNALL